MTTRNSKTERTPNALRLELAALLLIAGHACCAAQDVRAINSYPAGQGFGAANAGSTGRLPAGPPSAPARNLARKHGALNSYDAGFGFGAANAGGTGKLPRAPSAMAQPMTSLKHRGQGSDAARGGAATGVQAGGSSGNVGTSGTDGAGSR